MLSIDEAISHARDVAKRNREQWKNCPADRRDIEHQTCEQCAKEHEQIAEWLEELKCYKNDNDFSDYADRLHKIAFNSGYNKALDDFANTLKENYDYLPQILSKKAFDGYIDDYAEQLKEGDNHGH